MAISKVECYMVQCDDCKETLGNWDCDALHFKSVEDAEYDVENYGWCKSDDGNHFCEVCRIGVEDEEEDEAAAD